MATEKEGAFEPKSEMKGTPIKFKRILCSINIIVATKVDFYLQFYYYDYILNTCTIACVWTRTVSGTHGQMSIYTAVFCVCIFMHIQDSTWMVIVNDF